MTTRTFIKSVTFAQAFKLGGSDELLPAGSYSVETDEEMLEGLSFIAYRHVLTLLHLPPDRAGSALSRTLLIDPRELSAALMRDQMFALTGSVATGPGQAVPRINGPSMTSPIPDERTQCVPNKTTDMLEYGITRVPIDYFHYRGFRYTNLNDAIAQAKRDHTPA